MKLALIFLSVCFVAISHQQFHQPRPRALLWWSPYYQSLPVNHEDNYPQFSRQLMRRPSRPPPYFYGNYGDFNSDLIELNNEPNEVNDATFPDAESRIKSSNHFLQDSFDNQQSNPRFIYAFGSPASFYNPFFKTATFQLTSTVTLTTISRCVPLIQFAVSPPPACRRKRSVIDDAENDDQFIIDPSETLELTATALPGRQSRETRQVMDKSNSDDSLISSQNAEIPFGEMSKVDQFMANLRDKRFFLNRNSFFTSTTMTSYTFISTTITQTVSLGPGSAAIAAVVGPPAVAAVPAVAGVLRCLPAGYSVCP